MKEKWLAIQSVFTQSENTIAITPADSGAAQALLCMDIPENSAVGLVVAHTDCILVDSCLRVRGGSRFMQYNKELRELFGGDKIFVADDVWGGVFAISNGDFQGPAQALWYFAPDTLDWESMEIDYPRFLQWAASGKVEQFYRSFRWKGFREMASGLRGDQGIAIYPYLWTKECDIETAHKEVIPLREIVAVNLELLRQLGE